MVSPASKGFNRRRTGALNPGPPPSSQSVQLVYEDEGRVKGYLAGSLTSVDRTPFEAALDVAFDVGHPQALAELVRRALRVAREAGVSRVSARLPFDARVLDALREADISFSTHELESRPGSNMLQIIDIESMFRKLAPELEARLGESASAGWTGALAIEAEGRRVGLSIDRGGLVLADGEPLAFELRLTQAELMRLVLGLNTIDELAGVCSAKLRPAERTLLRDLFPVQPTASGPWG